MSFQTYYHYNPWAHIQNNVRNWYVPDLMRGYFEQPMIWRSQVPITHDLSPTGFNAPEVFFDFMGEYEPPTDPIPMDAMYVEPMTTDTKRLSITVARYGGKVQHNRITDVFNYWEEGGSKQFGEIVRSRLAPAIARHIEVLARNAFHRIVHASYAMDPAKTDFGDLTATDKFQLEWLDAIDLMFTYRGLPGFTGLKPGTKVCICSPGIIHDIRNSDKWVEWNLNTDGGRESLIGRVIAGSIGNTVFIPSLLNVLWNAGAIVAQKNILAPVQRGDGAATNYEGYQIGQPGATHHVTVNNTTDINVGDVVTVHVTRTSLYGVTNGVDPYSGRQWRRRVAAKTATTLSFDEPLNWPLTQDLGGGVYGYVTKARHIHAATFIVAPDAVVMGMAMPIRLERPVPVDDFNTIERTSYHGIFGFAPFRQAGVFNVFCSAPVTFNAANLAY